MTDGGEDTGDGDDARERPRRSTDGGDLPLDDVFDLLGDRRRRYVLYCLADWDGAVARDELARQVATWEHGGDLGDVPAESITRVTVSLDHVHLPRLVDYGVVTYDRESAELERAAGLDRLEPYLDLARDEEGF
ncbi:hypothetical protein ACFO0N_13960 [Halobium salinum]|uniref:DUF7344 domain-containing protein n=1 Tax=Halobium salinum TaxID=1364940 RepID=A0ABD5PEG6_9EURY|nr:hypothetical protein [Halobium salinum]